MKRKNFLKKAVLSIVTTIFLTMLFYPVCVENGVCDFWKLWVLIGVPFGIHRMCFWVIPKGFDLGGTVGMFVFNLLVGGVIGGFVLVWRLVIAVCCLAKELLSGTRWIARNVLGK